MNNSVEVYLNRLKTLKETDNPETAHADADDVLCELLYELGYEEIVEAYKAIEKWYA